MILEFEIRWNKPIFAFYKKFKKWTKYFCHDVFYCKVHLYQMAYMWVCVCVFMCENNIFGLYNKVFEAASDENIFNVQVNDIYV